MSDAAAKSPATPMVPFVVEALGRPSPEAHGLLGAVAPADKKVRSQVLRTAKQTLSVLVQTGLVELLLSAEPGRGGRRVGGGRALVLPCAIYPHHVACLHFAPLA